MAFVRVINPAHHYDTTRNEFKDLAFRPQRGMDGDVGVSCFDRECAIIKSGSICAHIEKHYKLLSSNPSIYWIFDSSKLPSGSSIIQKTENGDECHHNIIGASGTALRKVPKSWQASEMCMCLDSGIRPPTVDELILLATQTIAASTPPTPSTPGGSAPPP